MVFVDTPGIHRPLHRMNVRMVDTAVETLARSRCGRAWSSTCPKARAPVSAILLDLVKDTQAKVVLILNKIDLIKKHKMLPIIDQLSKERDWEAIVPVSATTGDNVAHLEEVLLNALPEGEPLYPERLPDRSTRARHGARDGAGAGAAPDARRAAVFDGGAHRSVPGADATRILTRIYATILVERDSQKPIVIGRGGEMIKTIGTAARKEMAKFFQTRCFSICASPCASSGARTRECWTASASRDPTATS